MVTHPEAPFLNVSIETQMTLAEHSNVWFERCYLSVLVGLSLHIIGEAIRTVAPTRTVLATDLGQMANPAPIDGLAEFLRGLGRAGIPDCELELMTVHNPARALGRE